MGSNLGCCQPIVDVVLQLGPARSLVGTNAVLLGVAGGFWCSDVDLA